MTGNKTQPQGRLAQVTGKAVTIDPAAHYDAWAATYETDLLDTYGYCAHRIAAQAFAHLVSREADVIDVGCGTGLVGAELQALGFAAIDGVDISARMLAQAEARGLYRRLILQDAEQPSQVPDGAYGGVISVGSFGVGHLGPGALPNLLAMAAPGAPLAVFMNAEPFEDEGYAAHLDRLSEARAWTLLGVEDHNYMDALERPGKLILARRAESSA